MNLQNVDSEPSNLTAAVTIAFVVSLTDNILFVM